MRNSKNATRGETEIVYNGILITKLFPSGYYEFYSHSQGRFLKFDSLIIAKSQIDGENNLQRIEMSRKS